MVSTGLHGLRVVIVQKTNLTKLTPIAIQLCLRFRKELWLKFYCALLGVTHYFSSYIVVRPTGQSGAEIKNGVPTV